MASRPVALRYGGHVVVVGEQRLVAPISAPMLQIVRLAGGRDRVGAGAEVLDDRAGAALDGEHAGDLEDDVLRAPTSRDSVPVSLTPMTFGQRTLNGKPVITSTASAPPTPMATMPSPPALGVWLSVPIIIPPGKA